MNESLYEVYAKTKNLIKRTKECEKGCSHEEEPIFKEWETIIESIEKAYPDIVGMYERRQEVINSFTREQIDHICYQIGDWYLMMKPLLEGQHNLGHMKEKLKTMICGE